MDQAISGPPHQTQAVAVGLVLGEPVTVLQDVATRQREGWCPEVAGPWLASLHELAQGRPGVHQHRAEPLAV